VMTKRMARLTVTVCAKISHSFFIASERNSE
jgi:hypothetical protein